MYYLLYYSSSNLLLPLNFKQHLIIIIFTLHLNLHTINQNNMLFYYIKIANSAQFPKTCNLNGLNFQDLIETSLLNKALIFKMKIKQY